LLLNIGPKGDGTVPAQTYERLVPVGQWIAQNGEALYGEVDRADVVLDWQMTGMPTLKGKTVYYWANHWVGEEMAIGGYQTKLLKASYLVGGQPIAFEQTDTQIILRGLPAECPDKIAGTCVLKFEFEAPPRQVLGAGYVIPQ
jgi:alpha-L-fucosidase